MSTVVYIEPSTLVDWMTDPGIRVNDFTVPVARYMSANVAFGGNAAASEILGPLQKMKGADGVPLVKQTRNFGRLMTGQGYYADFCLVMQFIADNLDQVRKIKGADKYFRKPDDARSVLQRMVAGKVFGMDCIGFTSQFLYSAGVWSEYKPYYPKDYLREFKPIRTLEDVRPLTFLIWGSHIAIVNAVHDLSTGKYGAKQLTVDICQSSDGTGITGANGVSGPQLNARAVFAIDDAKSDPVKFKVLHKGNPIMPVAASFVMANYKVDKLVSARDAMGF